MKLKEHLDYIESICSTCETCEPACAGNMFKHCFKSELEIEELLQCDQDMINDYYHFPHSHLPFSEQ
jgi:hypothetical protein